MKDISRTIRRRLVLMAVLLLVSVYVPGINASESPPYTVMIALEFTSPFVPDGRMSFSDFAFSATFYHVTFEFDPHDPLGACSVNAEKGKLILTRHAFNDVQEGDDRHRPWVKKEWPQEFPAVLGMAADPIVETVPNDKSDIPLVPLVPEKVKLRFKGAFGLLDLMWYSKLGSCSLDDMYFEFEVPWQKLLAGKAHTVKLPYQGSDPEETGSWWIEFIPERK